MLQEKIKNNIESHSSCKVIINTFLTLLPFFWVHSTVVAAVNNENIGAII